MFNNAGVNAPAVPMDELPLDKWFNVLNTNVTGVFLCARAAFGLMRRQTPQGGRIINNGSISAHVPRPFTAPYTASKHAVSGITKALALDGRAYNIVASQIDIGNALTELSERMTRGVLQANGTTVPAVSYTHLDVYKRQVHFGPGNHLDGGDSANRSVHGKVLEGTAG